MKLLNRLPKRREPEIEEKPRSRYGVLEDIVVERLQLRRAQAFYDDLLSMEQHWIWLLPILGWVGWRTYKRERRATIARNEIIRAGKRALGKKR